MYTYIHIYIYREREITLYNMNSYLYWLELDWYELLLKQLIITNCWSLIGINLLKQYLYWYGSCSNYYQ